jgi:hypothetical protein
VVRGKSPYDWALGTNGMALADLSLAARLHPIATTS